MLTAGEGDQARKDLLGEGVAGGRALIDPRQEAGGPLLVSGVFREAFGEDRLFVVHAAQLKGDLHRENKRARQREELHQEADHREFFGDVERVANEPVWTRGDEAASFCHHAERPAEPHQRDHRRR